MTEVADRIVTSIANGVMTIRMNRPDKKNALTADMYSRMSAGLDEANANGDVNAILILGSTGAFSSGNDIGDFMQVAMSGNREDMSVFGFLERIIQAPKPLIAGVAGFVSTITASADLELIANQAAENIASKPQQALKLSRDLLRGDRADVLKRMREEAILFGERLESEEAKQAFMSFMQKGVKKAS